VRFKKPKPPKGKEKVQPASRFPTIVAGFPDFWQPAHDRHPQFYKAAGDLIQLVNEVIRRPLTGQLQIVLGFMTGTVSNSLGALITLSMNGYGHDALRISRGMFETSVNAAYLQRHQSEVGDFLDYHWVNQKKRLEYMEQHCPEAFKRLPAGTVTEANTEYARVLPRFADKRGKPRSSWSSKSVRARAEEVGLGEFYPTFYAEASGVHHCDFAGLATQSISGRLQVDIAPSFAGIKDALMMGHQCVPLVIESINKVADLGLDAQLSAACAAYVEAWRPGGSNIKF
jgi:Family of unknown function (DUF5677)